MADTTSPLLGFTLMETGNDDETWGDIANTVFTRLEDAIANYGSVVVTGGTRTLTIDEAAPQVIKLTGTLTADLIVEVPAHAKRYTFWDATTHGSYGVKVKITGISGT